MIEQTPANAVLTCLQEQVGCYRQLARLAELQHEHVQQGQTEQLLSVLTRRQEVLNRITSLEATLAPMRKQWGDFLLTLDAATRASAEKLMSQARALLEEITTADRNDTMVLQQRKIEISRQIGQIGRGQQVNRRYAASAYSAANRSVVDVRSK